MDKDKIKSFQYRVSQANRSELVVITLDIGIEYLEGARTACSRVEYNECLRSAKRVVDYLISCLSDEGEAADMSSQLLGLYMVWQRYIMKAGYDYSEENICLIEKVVNMLRKLRESFLEVSRQDVSEPLMSNAHKVYAGLTYSSGGSTNESFNSGVNRGYCV